MKMKYWLAIILTVTFGSRLMAAQAPSGSTGQCKDGSYTTAAKKSGACSGHKGVQTWFGATSTVSASNATTGPGQEPAAPATAAAPKSAPAPAPSSPSTPARPAPSMTAGQEPTPPAAPAQPGLTASQSGPRQQAPGGGPGMVWVNTSSKVYHCPGTQFYGTTKNGKYMSEADAVSMGARADHNKACPR